MLSVELCHCNTFLCTALPIFSVHPLDFCHGDKTPVINMKGGKTHSGHDTVCTAPGLWPGVYSAGRQEKSAGHWGPLQGHSPASGGPGASQQHHRLTTKQPAHGPWETFKIQTAAHSHRVVVPLPSSRVTGRAGRLWKAKHLTRSSPFEPRSGLTSGPLHSASFLHLNQEL